MTDVHGNAVPFSPLPTAGLYELGGLYARSAARSLTMGLDDAARDRARLAVEMADAHFNRVVIENETLVRGTNSDITVE